MSRQPYDRPKRDWVRAATWGTILAATILFWGWIASELPGWLSR